MSAVGRAMVGLEVVGSKHEERFCAGCKHVSKVERQQDWKCNAPGNFVEVADRAMFLVTGEQQPTIRATRGGNCATLRRKDYPPEIAAVVCGPEGKWFVSANESVS